MARRHPHRTDSSMHRGPLEGLPVDPDLAPDDPAEPRAARRPTTHRRRSRDLRSLLAIGLGGFLGALARYEVTQAWPTPVRHFPWATFAINTSGAAFLGLVLTLLLGRPHHWPLARPLLCVGFTGAWTTMSAVAVEADLLVEKGVTATVVLYVVSTVVAGIAASWAGTATARRIQVGMQ